MLLILGGLLLTVAAIVFTVVSWGYLGIGGRAAILAAITAVTLTVPWLLLKRGLTATAETIGVLGLALLLLDGYAARRVGLFHNLLSDDYTALVIGFVALSAVGYTRVLPLRLPLPIAIVLAQIPLPLLAAVDTPGMTTGAFVVTVAMDAAIWAYLTGRLRTPGAAEVHPGIAGGKGAAVTAAVCLGITGIVGLLVGIFYTLFETTFAGVLPVALGLLGFAAVGVFVATRTNGALSVLPLAPAVIAAAMALAAPVRPLLEANWQVLPFPIAGLIVAALAFLLPVRLRQMGAAMGAAFAVLAAVPYAPVTLMVLGEPFAQLDAVWAGNAPELEAAARPAVIVLLLFAAASRAAATWRPNPGALYFATLAVLLVPTAYGLGYVAAVGVPLVLAVLLSVFAAVKDRDAAWAAGVAAAVAIAWSLSAESATYVTLGALFVTWGIFYRRPASLAGAALSGGGLVWALLGGAGMRVLDSCAVGFAAAAALALLGAYGAARRTEKPAELKFGGDLAIVLAVLSVLPVFDVFPGVLATYAPVGNPWRGVEGLVTQRPLVVVALVLASAVLILATRNLAVALVAGAVVVAALPAAVRLPYSVTLIWLVAGTVAGVALALKLRKYAAVAAGAAIWLGTLAIGAAVAEQTATLVVLPVLAVIALAAALLSQTRGQAGTLAGTLATVLAALLAAVEVHAVRVAFDLPEASLASTGAGVVAIAAGLAARRPALSYLGTAFLLAASWLRLWAEGIEVVEAYTLPFSLVLLGVGWWHARGGQVSSWRAYGAGLLFTFAPSVLAEPTPLRSLLLGTAALAVTVAGTRFRLQAPTVLGGIALTVVVVRELSPWIVELVTVLPRWVPIAVGGLLLVVVGATYEARKRDVVRFKNAVAKLR